MVNSHSFHTFRRWSLVLTLLSFFIPVITYVVLLITPSLEWVNTFLLFYNLVFPLLLLLLVAANTVAIYKTTIRFKFAKGLLAGFITALLMVASWGVMNFVFYNNCCLDDSFGQEAFERLKESNSSEDEVQVRAANDSFQNKFNWSKDYRDCPTFDEFTHQW